MVKIIFEVSEDFIKENIKEETLYAKMKKAEGASALKILFDMVGFKQLDKQVSQGKTEFLVTPDKLDDKSKDMYEQEIGTICVLAAFSETDKVKKEAE